MPLYLADTSAWSRSAATPGTIARWRALLAEAEVAVCSPVRLELLYAARKRDYGRLAAHLRDLPDLRVDDRSVERAEEIQAALAQTGQHRGPRPVDLLIAAIADVHEAVLLHYDRHFDAIRRVTRQPMEWLAPRGSIS